MAHLHRCQIERAAGRANLLCRLLKLGRRLVHAAIFFGALLQLAVPAQAQDETPPAGDDVSARDIELERRIRVKRELVLAKRHLEFTRRVESILTAASAIDAPRPDAPLLAVLLTQFNDAVAAAKSAKKPPTTTARVDQVPSLLSLVDITVEVLRELESLDSEYNTSVGSWSVSRNKTLRAELPVDLVIGDLDNTPTDAEVSAAVRPLSPAINFSYYRDELDVRVRVPEISPVIAAARLFSVDPERLDTTAATGRLARAKSVASLNAVQDSTVAADSVRSFYRSHLNAWAQLARERVRGAITVATERVAALQVDLADVEASLSREDRELAATKVTQGLQKETYGLISTIVYFLGGHSSF